MINLIRDMFCPILSDRTIKKYNAKGELIIGEIKPEQLQPNSVDLTLGGTYSIIEPNEEDRSVDIKKAIKYKHSVFKDAITISPKQFILMASEEVLNIPNGIVGFVQGRSSVARIGLQTEQAGLIDAGFRGTITFELYNESNHAITLYKGMRIAQVYFFKAEKAVSPYGEARGSKYYYQLAATGSKLDADFK